MTTAQQQIGRYVVLDEIGRGAAGVVYRAHDPAIGRAVAIKVLHAAPGLTPRQRAAVRERFIREARMAGNLDHPNLVRIFDVGEDEGGQLYIVMEYMSGPSLERLAESRTLDPAEIAGLLAQIASALDAAHAQGVIHRDVKSANILMTADGTPKIADFGVAQMPNAHLTQDARYLGTPAAMSPEQVTGKTLDHRADLFSLGVLCYRLLTGRSPFEGDDAISLAYQIVHAPPRPVSAFHSELPRSLDLVFEKMLAKEPEQRYASGREFHAAFAACLAPAAPKVEKPISGVARGRGAGAFALLGILLLVAIVAVFSALREDAEAPRPEGGTAATPAKTDVAARGASGTGATPPAPRPPASPARAANAKKLPAPVPLDRQAVATKPPAKAKLEPKHPVSAPPARTGAAVRPPPAEHSTPSPAAVSAPVAPAASNAVTASGAEATVTIRHALSQGTLTVFLNGKPVLSDAFSKKKWVPFHLTEWSGLPVPSGDHVVTAEVTGEDGKVYRSEPATIGFEDGKVTAVRITFKADALVIKRKER